MGFLYVGQGSLELLTSGDLLTLASQSAGITGVTHRGLAHIPFIIVIFFFLQSVISNVCSEIFGEQYICKWII